MRQTSHVAALVSMTLISALLALFTGIIGLNADDLETMLGLNYWSHLFTVATIVGMFAAIVLSGVRAYLTPESEAKPADTLPNVAQPAAAQVEPEPVQEEPQEPRPYRPGHF